MLDRNRCILFIILIIVIIITVYVIFGMARKEPDYYGRTTKGLRGSFPSRKTNYLLNPVQNQRSRKLGDYEIFTIENMFTSEECENFIATEGEIFKKSIEIHREKQETKQFQKMAKFPKIKAIIDARITYWAKSLKNTQISKDAENWDIYDSVRLVHYYDGQKIDIHRDKMFEQNGKHTKYVALLYLNEGYEGGRTIVYPEASKVYNSEKETYAPVLRERQKIRDETPNIVINPKKGMVAFYDANILHEGEEVVGEKWLLIFRFVV